MESELLALLQNAKPNRDKLDELIKVLEAAASIDLSDVEQQQQLEGVWELRWSSSKQPFASAALAGEFAGVDAQPRARHEPAEAAATVGRCWRGC